MLARDWTTDATGKRWFWLKSGTSNKFCNTGLQRQHNANCAGAWCKGCPTNLHLRATRRPTRRPTRLPPTPPPAPPAARSITCAANPAGEAHGGWAGDQCEGQTTGTFAETYIRQEGSIFDEYTSEKRAQSFAECVSYCELEHGGEAGCCYFNDVAEYRSDFDTPVGDGGLEPGMVRTCRFYPGAGVRSMSGHDARALPDQYAAWCVDSLPSDRLEPSGRLLPAADEACGLVVVGTGYCRSKKWLWKNVTAATMEECHERVLNDPECFSHAFSYGFEEPKLGVCLCDTREDCLPTEDAEANGGAPRGAARHYHRVTRACQPPSVPPLPPDPPSLPAPPRPPPAPPPPASFILVKVDDDPLSWAAAAQSCVGRGGRLAVLNTAEAHAAAEAAVLSAEPVRDGTTPGGYPYTKAWIGGGAGDNPASFIWGDRQQTPLCRSDLQCFHAWGNGEGPTNVGSNGCMYLEWGTEGGAKWFNKDCSAQYGYLCEVVDGTQPAPPLLPPPPPRLPPAPPPPPPLPPLTPCSPGGVYDYMRYHPVTNKQPVNHLPADDVFGDWPAVKACKPGTPERAAAGNPEPCLGTGVLGWSGVTLATCIAQLGSTEFSFDGVPLPPAGAPVAVVVWSTGGGNEVCRRGRNTVPPAHLVAPDGVPILGACRLFYGFNTQSTRKTTCTTNLEVWAADPSRACEALPPPPPQALLNCFASRSFPDGTLQKYNNANFQRLAWNYGCEVGNGFSAPSECDGAVTLRASGGWGCCGSVPDCHSSACSGARAVPQRAPCGVQLDYGPFSAEPAATHAAAGGHRPVGDRRRGDVRGDAGRMRRVRPHSTPRRPRQRRRAQGGRRRRAGVAARRRQLLGRVRAAAAEPPEQ